MIAVLRQRRIGIIRLQVMPPRRRLFDGQGLGRRLWTPFFVGSVAEFAKGASAGAAVQGAGDFEDSAEEGLEDGDGGDGDADEGADAGGRGGLGVAFWGMGEGEDLRGPHCGLGDAPWRFSQGWMLRCS